MDSMSNFFKDAFKPLTDLGKPAQKGHTLGSGPPPGAKTGGSSGGGGRAPSFVGPFDVTFTVDDEVSLRRPSTGRLYV